MLHLLTPAAMLNLNNITVRLGGRVILDGASAALPPGSRVGLIGRNGAGKSTMVRVIAAVTALALVLTGLGVALALVFTGDDGATGQWARSRDGNMSLQQRVSLTTTRSCSSRLDPSLHRLVSLTTTWSRSRQEGRMGECSLPAWNRVAQP